MEKSFRTRLGAAAFTATFLASFITTVFPASASAAPINSAVTSAANYAAANGVKAGVAVLDDNTGALYVAGNYNAGMGSASVVKVFMASWLLAAGRMSGTDASTAYYMITQSDNNAYTTLLNKYIPGSSVGAKSGWLVAWASSYFHISGLGYVSYTSWCWGNTHITARGMVQFYRAVKHNSKVGPWLMNAMHHHATYGSDGANQTFGIPSATTGSGVKQGWGSCSSDLGGSVINTTGYVNNNRYTVAILTDTKNGNVNASPYNTWQANIVSNMAKILMPGGNIDLPQNHNPFGHVDGVTVSGNTLHVWGWTIDPDLKNGSVYVRVYIDNTLVSNIATATYRADVNTAFHVTGYHGYNRTSSITTGTHKITVRYMNYSYGTVTYVDYAYAKTAT